jgi:hypothetical protein
VQTMSDTKKIEHVLSSAGFLAVGEAYRSEVS